MIDIHDSVISAEPSSEERQRAFFDELGDRWREGRDPTASFAAALTFVLGRRGITAYKFRKISDINEAMVHRMLNGQRLPTVVMVERIVRAVEGITIEEEALLYATSGYIPRELRGDDVARQHIIRSFIHGLAAHRGEEII